MKIIYDFSTDWLRQLPRHVKAEERRWERLLARGGESPQTVRDLKEWTDRAQRLDMQVAAELRWLARNPTSCKRGSRNTEYLYIPKSCSRSAPSRPRA